MLLVALAYVLLGVETHGRTIEEVSAGEARPAQPRLAAGN
jgi:hypothetical protein